MQDIEDCTVHDAGSVAVTHHAAVNPRTRAATNRAGTDVPGDATVFVHTFGCGHNVSDGEYMAGQLAEYGYRITDDFLLADCFLINSCTVKNPSEEHFVTMLKRAKQTGKPVVVAGCVPQGDQQNPEWSDVSVVGVRQIDRVNEVVTEALRGNVTRLLADEVGHDSPSRIKTSNSHLPSLEMPKIRRNKFIEIIPINVGCLNNCTYCKTKHARGDLKSWPVADIVARVRQVCADPCVKEIRLTSEDVGAYGIDIGTTIVVLLRAILKALEGTQVMLRIGMSNPPYLLRHVDELAELLRHPNCYEFVHIPVQSGDNGILEVMKREYTVEEFLTCVRRINAVVPGVSVGTDIICGFPGEGEVEWSNTLSLVRLIKFPVLNISRFYPRRGTPAASMKLIPSDVAKRRTAEITALYNSYQTYGDLLGTEHRVWLVEVAHDKHHLVGHTKSYVQVLVDPATASLGEMVTVRVTATSKYSVTGSVISSEQSVVTEPTDRQRRSEKNNKRAAALVTGTLVGLLTVAVVVGVLFARRKRRFTVLPS
jgi:threonylcarbamoyladenosine tRNA methylthiotransferase CDKAL1